MAEKLCVMNCITYILSLDYNVMGTSLVGNFYRSQLKLTKQWLKCMETNHSATNAEIDSNND